MKFEFWERGTQVLSVPWIAHGDLTHRAVRAGFVVSPAPMGQTVLVRYWEPGKEREAIATDYHGQASDTANLRPYASILQGTLEREWLSPYE